MNWNSSQQSFPLHPAGSFYAVCVDVYDKQEKNNFYGSTRPDGSTDTRENILVAYIEFLTDQNQRVRFKANATLGTSDKPSNLRKFIKTWNAKVNDKHLDSFNPEVMLGWPAYLTVQHRDSKNGKSYANVIAAMAPPPGSPVPTIPADFVRQKDKATAQPVATTPQPVAANEPPPHSMADAPPVKEEDDDLPF